MFYHEMFMRYLRKNQTYRVFNVLRSNEPVITYCGDRSSRDVLFLAAIDNHLLLALCSDHPFPSKHADRSVTYSLLRLIPGNHWSLSSSNVHGSLWSILGKIFAMESFPTKISSTFYIPFSCTSKLQFGHHDSIHREDDWTSGKWCTSGCHRHFGNDYNGTWWNLVSGYRF